MGWERERAVLLARTVRFLRPMQVVHRVRLQSQLRVFGFAPSLVRFFAPARSMGVTWPADFVPLDLRLTRSRSEAELVASGTFRFLGEERSLGDPPHWDHASRSRLWRFRLHDFEWAFSLAAHPDREWAGHAFRRLWKSWRSSVGFGDRDAWAPYVASLRAWALLCVFDRLVRGSPEEAGFTDDLALHAGFIRAHLELDVGGNHVIKNLKSLLGLGVLLDNDKLVHFAISRLENELGRQVLLDGGHYERSPSYHCQVLGDLIDSRELAKSAGLASSETLDYVITLMRRWLGTMLMPDGDVPLFNDCTLVGKDRIELLEPTRAKQSRLVVLEPSGYVVVRPTERTHLVLDVGPPCPPDLPAHAHADCLSFELAVDGRRVLVDTGTSTYDPGSRRGYERSTRAHNTVEVDAQNQTEVWGVFRAARRAIPRLELAAAHGEQIDVSASHDGYRRLPGGPLHRRTWQISANRVAITDELLGLGHHTAVARLHLAPDLETMRDREAIRSGPLAVSCSERLSLEPATIATGFGERWPTKVVIVEVEGKLPIRVATDICLNDPKSVEGHTRTVG